MPIGRNAFAYAQYASVAKEVIILIYDIGEVLLLNSPRRSDLIKHGFVRIKMCVSVAWEPATANTGTGNYSTRGT